MNSFFSGKFVWVLGLALALTASGCSCSGGEQQPVAENTAAVVQPSEAPSKKFTLGVNPSAKPVVLDEKPLAGTYQVMDPKLKLPVAIFETPAGWVGSSQVRWLNSYPNVAVWKVNFSHPRTEVAGSYTSNIMICGEPTTVAKMELMKNPQSLVDICLDDVKSLANFKGKIKVEDAKIIPNDGLRISKLAEEIDKTAETVPFDVVLLSNHLFRGKDFYVDRECYDLEKKDLHREYIGIMAEMCEKCNNFDVAAHYDYINRYADNKSDFVTYDECPKEFDRFFEALISKGKALEINTKSIRKHIDGGFTRHLPDEAILNRYRAMGGNLICLGSDSHFPGTFGVCFDEAIQYLKSLGFTESVYFKAHKPVFEQL